MNFAALPPEINSALMYTGAGSGPIRTAAGAWQTMAGDLETAAHAYQAVITTLTDQAWHGPSALAMAAAAAPYVTWLHTTATQAGHAATLATAAATAYETAFAATVPPPVIAANRAQLATLIATNLLGQNTPAIAATEAHYAAMWAQDATAMYGYATGAAAATRLPTFTTPKPAANPAADGSGYQGAGETGLLLDMAVTAVEVESFAPFEGGGAGLEFGSLAIEAASLGPFEGIGLGGLGGLGTVGELAPVALAGQVAPAAGLSAPAAGLSRTGAVWAGAGRAVPLGALSVPQAWAAAAPAALRQVTLAAAQAGTAAAAQVSTVAAAAQAGASAGVPYAEMALAGMAGRAVAGVVKRDRTEPSSQTLPTAAPAPAAAEASDAAAPAARPAVGIVAELRALVELRDTGVLTAAAFAQRKQRLLAGK